MKSYTFKKQTITQIAEDNFKCSIILTEKNNEEAKTIQIAETKKSIDEAIAFVESTLNKHGLLSLWS